MRALPAPRPPVDGSHAQEEINTRLWRDTDMVRQYESVHLTPAEATALIRYRDAFLGGRVLDLGCGAGRIAAYLRPHGCEYVGLDISPRMVAACRRRLPGMTFEVGDMRDLSAFVDGSFAAVLAVLNLFDAAGHADRLRTLAGIRRALKPGGLLIFSAHNRACRAARDGPALQRSRNPVTQLWYVYEYFRARGNRRRIGPHQREEDEYALVNDCAHGYSALHYYIGRAAQERQLAGCGFDLVECLDESGRTLGAGEEAADDPSIHYVARRPG
jgi:SAM-dependent methyltransferase